MYLLTINSPTLKSVATSLYDDKMCIVVNLNIEMLHNVFYMIVKWARNCLVMGCMLAILCVLHVCVCVRACVYVCVCVCVYMCVCACVCVCTCRS